MTLNSDPNLATILGTMTKKHNNHKYLNIRVCLMKMIIVLN